MRNTKILAALAALVGTIPAFGFTGLSPRAEAGQTIDLAKAIDTLQSSARVTAKATLTTDYGTGFEGLNTTEDYSIDRIYGTIAEDGSATRAVRDLAAANPITYYEGENHNVWTDYLLPDNTVALLGLAFGYPKVINEIKPRLPREAVFMENEYRDPAPGVIERYDETMREYYSTRTHSKKTCGWSEQLEEIINREKRAYLLQHIKRRGWLEK